MKNFKRLFTSALLLTNAGLLIYIHKELFLLPEINRTLLRLIPILCVIDGFISYFLLFFEMKDIINLIKNCNEIPED